MLQFVHLVFMFDVEVELEAEVTLEVELEAKSLLELSWVVEEVRLESLGLDGCDFFLMVEREVVVDVDESLLELKEVEKLVDSIEKVEAAEAADAAEGESALLLAVELEGLIHGCFERSIIEYAFEVPVVGVPAPVVDVKEGIFLI